MNALHKVQAALQLADEIEGIKAKWRIERDRLDALLRDPPYIKTELNEIKVIYDALLAKKNELQNALQQQLDEVCKEIGDSVPASVRAYISDLDTKLEERERGRRWKQALADFRAFAAGLALTGGAQLRRKISVDLAASSIRFADHTYVVKPNAAAVMQMLIDANGEYVPLRNLGYRTRDLDDLPPPVQSLIERAKGIGARLRPM